MIYFRILRYKQGKTEFFAAFKSKFFYKTKNKVASKGTYIFCIFKSSFLCTTKNLNRKRRKVYIRV